MAKEKKNEKNKIKRLPDGKIKGILTMGDLIDKERKPNRDKSN